MSPLFIIPVALIVIGLLWWKQWIRRGMWTSGLFALPFILVQPLVSHSVHLVGQGIVGFLLSAVWVFLIGCLAGAFYTFFLHRHLTPVVHPRRSLLRWLFLGPLVSILIALVTRESLLVSALIGLGVDVLLVIMLYWPLVWDTLMAMSGMALLYVLMYFLFGQVVHGAANSGVLFLGYPLEDIWRILAFGALWGPPYAGLRILSKVETPFLPQHHVPKQVAVVASLVVALIGLAWVNIQFITVPKVIAASPAANQTTDSLSSPITLQLDRPLDRASVNVTVTPTVEGDISFADSYLQRTFVRRIIFTPRTYFQPDTTYTVKVTSLKNVLGQQKSDYSYQFHTPALPGVAQITPKDSQTDVAICDPFSVVLTQPANELSQISFQTNPPVDVDVAQSADKKTYTLKPKECLAQSQAYTLTTLRLLQVQAPDGSLLSTGDPAVIGTTTFTTKGAPGVTSVTPQGGGVLTDTKNLTIGFTEPMEQSDLATDFTVSTPGTWAWRDPQTAVYTFPGALDFDTKYTVTQAQTLKDAKGGFLSPGATFSFTTIGHVQVSSVSPRNGVSGVNVTSPVSITFDQPVDHPSAESRFSISPSVSGSFSWSGNTMTFQTSLDHDTAYQITVASGVHSLIGLDLAGDFTSSFQSEESVTQLNVPVYYQQHALSCEVASLKMALNFKGVGVSEDQLLSQLPTDSSARNGDTWADPNQVFVGDVNGQQDKTGYGVHAGPILALASNYRSAESVTGWSVQNLAQTLADGNPIVIWGFAGSGKADSWTTPGGSQINTVIGEHARTLIGFTGKASNPTGFIINDPIFGRLHWTTAQFKANWAVLGSIGVAIL